jgi:hypothetical protein
MPPGEVVQLELQALQDSRDVPPEIGGRFGHDDLRASFGRVAVTHKGKHASVGDSNACDPDCVQVVVSLPELQPETAFELVRLGTQNGDRVSKAHVGTVRVAPPSHHHRLIGAMGSRRSRIRFDSTLISTPAASGSA